MSFTEKKPLIVGITGGIGSGKTTIARYFNSLGIPLYIADTEAKAIMNRSEVIKEQLIDLFGEEAYVNNELHRAYIKAKIFNDKTLLTKMNTIVHPEVASHFKQWLKDQRTAYVIKEAAIIFENNLESQYDLIITVTADKDSRIQRILDRDSTSEETIIAIMNNQLSDEDKSSRSDFVIENNDLHVAKHQALKIHHKLLAISKID